jgi:IclR family acetate operon transcriptional repressor
MARRRIIRLADRPEGASLASIATELDQLRSGCHRTLNELVRFGYVRQIMPRGTYVLTTKLAPWG